MERAYVARCRFEAQEAVRAAPRWRLLPGECDSDAPAILRAVKESSRQWIEAAKTLNADPSALVRCPENGDGLLEATWLPATSDEAGRGELMLRCQVCGAVNYALYAKRPEHF
jgi:hypothetical protein